MATASTVRILKSALIVVAVAFGISWVCFGIYAWTTAPQTPDVLAECLEPSSAPTFASECLHKNIDQLLEYYAAKTLLEYVVASSSPANVRAQCHAVGHIIGEQTYARSSSLESALARCSHACRSSCLHGAIGAGVFDEMGSSYPDEDIAHADAATLERLANTYCEYSSSLCHAIGHIALIAHEDDARALSVCDRVSGGFLRESCYQGVFMERAGGGEALFPFITNNGYGSSERDFTDPCTQVEPQYRHACFQFLTKFQLPLFQANSFVSHAQRLQKAVETCASLSGRDRASCFEGIGLQSELFGYSALNGASLRTLCDSMPSENDRYACTLGVLPRFFFMEDELLLGYCLNIGDMSHRELCYDAAFTWFESIYETRQIAARCAHYPICRAHYERFGSSTAPDYRFGLFGR